LLFPVDELNPPVRSAAFGTQAEESHPQPVREAGSADPVWSPDGTRILFLDNRVVRGKGRTGLATIRPDGSARTFLSRANIESHQPDWQSIHS
jgi:hypothetical protein